MTDTLGYVTIIKRTGADGYRYPLNRPSCLFGRSTECDIRLQLPVVSKQQCRIEFNQQLKEAVLINLNSSNPTHLNGTTICHPVKLEHGDLITIFDRSFRFEYECGIQNEGKPPIRPSGPKNKEVMPARSRSISTLDYEPCQRRERHHHSFSDIPTEHTEENNTRPFSLMSYLEEMNADKPKKCDDTSDNVEEHLAGKTPTLHKKEPKKSTTNVTEKSSISIDPAADCSEDVNVSPTFPKKNENHDFSPFKKLFGLMKGELNSNRQQVGHQSYPSSRKSGPKIQISMDDREQKTEPLRSSPSRASPRSQGHLNILNAFGELQEGRSAKEGKPKVLQRSLARGSPGPALELERSHEEERWFEDPYESALEQSQAERFPAERPSQEVERLKAPRKRRSEGLAARNSGRRKEEDRRRSAPLLLPSENPSHPSSLYTLRSQTKRFSSWESGKLPKLGGETAQAPDHMGTPVLKESDFNGGGASPDMPKNKGSLLKNNQITPKKKASSSEEIAKETEKEEFYFEGNVNESDRSAKRRRVSFGVHLRPELFDENLPPNTPLKRGESPGIRRKGGSQPQTVLRKSIIKEHSKLLEKEPSSHTVEEGVALHAHVQDLSPELPETKKIFACSSISQSCENAESVAGEIQFEKMNKPSSSKSPAAGRRSQHDILQRIYAKRRSGASEANLMVVRSWADVVRLGTRKPQTDVVVKHGLERRIIKKQKRLTPKKPPNSIKDSFGTGHANSPCTIMIGRAHTEKVTVPIRPCRMLNNFVLKTDMDMNEDFTGLADMFKIHINKKRKSETGTAPPLLFEEMSCKEHPPTSSGDEHTSDECAKKLISTTQDAAQELLASSIFSCRRSPRNRQSRGGDNITKIPEMGNDEIIIPGVEDHKILTSSSKRLKTCTPKENEASSPYRNRIKTPENQKIICIEEKLENGSANRATKKFKLSMEQSVDLNFYNPETPNSTLNTLEDSHIIKRLTEMPNKEDSKENSIEKHTNLKNQNKEILDQLGVTPPLKIRSTKEQPVTNQPVEIPKHRRMSLQNQKYSPTEVNKMTSLKPVIVCPDVIPTSKTVTIKHELGDMKKKVTRTPKQKIELVEYEDLSGIRELMTTPRPTAKDKVADFTGDDGKVQKKRRSSVPKQKIELVEDEDLSGIRELMTTPRPTAKDKMTGSSGDDGKVQKNLRSSTPKQKIELVEYDDLSGIRELVTTPRPTAKDKVANFTGNDGKVQEKRRSSILKQKIEVVEEQHLSGIRELMVTPRPIAKDKMTDSSGDDGKVQRKCRSSTPKQKIEVVEDEDLSGIRELMATPRPTVKDKVADFAGDDGKVQRKRRSSTPKQKIEVVEDEDLSGIRELMATPRPTVKDKVADFAGDDGKVQRKRRSSTPKQKIEVVEDEDLSGIRELMATPRPTVKDKVADFAGNDGKVQKNHRGSTQKQKIEVVEDEDLSGIRELMATPRPTTKDKVADFAGNDGKVQKNHRGSTQKQKIELVEYDDLSGIRELMTTPRTTAKDKMTGSSGDDGKVQKNLRSSTPKQKIELIEDENLSGILEFMTTPTSTTKDKVVDFAGGDGKVQKNRRGSTQKQKIELVEYDNLSGIRELMTTPRPTAKDKMTGSSGDDGKVQKNLRSSTPKQKIELVGDENLSGIWELMTTPGPRAKDKVADFAGDDGKVQKKRRSSTPKQKIEVVEDEDLSGIRELMATPRSTTKEKVAGFAGNDGKVQKNRRGSTQKQEIELVEYEDLSGIRELMTTPRPTTKDKMTDSSGDDGKVQKNLRSSTPKQKIEMVEDEDLSGIRELMTTPRPTAKDKMTDSSGDDGKIQKKRRSSTPKQKLEMVEDEDLSGIRELMTTPRSTKDKVTDFVEDDGKVQKNLTTSKQIVCTDTDAKVQKKLMRSVKQQIEMEDLNDTEQLKKTPKRKCEPAEDLTMVKRLMRSPKDKVEPEEVVVCSERLLRTPKEKAPTVVESLRRLVPPLEENLESLITPKQRVVDLVKDNVNKDVILTKCDSENLSRTRRQSRIAKEKEELIEDVKCVKNSIKTAKQKCDPVEDAIALGTKNLSKTQPIDDNSGLGKLISKPQEGKNVENIAYPKKLMKTPKGKIALLKIPTNKVKPEDLNMTFNERGELTTEDPVNTKKLVRTPKEKEGELMKDLNAIRLTTPKVKGQLDKDLTGVIVFMGTPNKVEDINNAQEISESDSELLQELKMLRKKAIDDFSASNQEPQIIEEILEPAQEVKPQTVGGGRVRNKLPKSRKRVVGDVYKLKTPSRTKDSNVEVDYTGFKEMFESPEESKDYSEEVDQFQLQICTNPFEKDKDKSDPSKTDGSLYSMSLKENVKKDETTQAQQEHDTLPSEIENPFTKKNQKKSLLRFQGEIKDTGGLNQRTLRTRRKTTFDAESKVTSTKIDDEKIVKNITMGRNKKSLDSFLDEVSDKNDSSERTLRSRRNTRFNAESTPASAKMDDGSLEHSEKEEPVKTGSRTFCNAESRRHQTHKEVQSCSSSFSEGEKENSEETVDNLKKRVAGRATSRSRSKNKNAESPNESNVSHTNDEKCSDNKRLTEEKLIQKMAAPPLRFSSRNKTSKELLVSPSSLLSETNRSPREKNEKKKRVTITTRNTSKADIKLQESTGSLVNKIVSSPKEGDEEEKFEKRVGNRGNSVLRSRNRNKSKDMLPCESNISYTDEERENIKNLPEKQKEHKVRVTVSRNSKFLNTCDSLYSSGNNENPMNSCDQGRTDVNEKGIGLRTRSRNKSKEKQESYSIHTECREDNERSLPARSKSISVNEKMASSRTRNRIKNATETQEVNTLPTEVYKPQTEEKSKVASPGKVGKSRSKKKTDLKKSEPIRSSPEKLEPQSKNQDVTETQEVPPLCCVQTEPDQHNASLRSRTRKRLLHSSSVEPEELCLKDEKPVKTQKRLNDTTEDGKLSLKPKRKRKMDTELRDSAEEEKIPVGIRPLTRKRNKVDKELQEIPPVSSANEIAIAEADEEKLSNLGNKLRGKAKENAIAEADEEKLSGLRNKLRGKAKGKTKESFEVEESNGFPLSSATDIAYTLDLSPSGTFSNKRLTNRRGMGSRLKNKSDTNLQTSADVSKTDPSTASMSQTSVIGSKYKHKSDLEQQRSSNLSEDNSSTAASKTILTGSGKAKRGKKVDFTLSTKKRGRAATTSIKTEATAVENFSIPHSPPKSSQVQDNLSAAKGTKSGLKAQSKLKTNQTREKSALSGSEKNYTLRGTRPTTRSSKQK
ncbi:proliferation marker protein Ki-67 isoform X2 [Sarcophilus harrisii]|uniref:proliferation marker protein Ki-67 isoform X2 n=1 Tax=Sarcophilus harrisii TaxID=9305 RepID=UPI001301ED64|nr:proliferation marker protein Ki-67 isoform X2 [Sarcophilus harrisii]